MSVFDVPAKELIERTAKELKNTLAIKPPSWADFVKTGMSRDRPPANQDWWYVRAASILRKAVILGPIGTSKLRGHYSGRKNRGMAGEHTYKAGGNIIRKILQQLEKSGLLKQAKKGNHKGRIATPKGLSLLNKISTQIMKELNIVIPQTPKEETQSTEQTEKKAQKKKK